MPIEVPICTATTPAITADSNHIPQQCIDGQRDSSLATSPTHRYHPFMSLQPFHIAFPVDDLDAARYFYGTILGCPEGRSSDHWVDFDLFGHQIVAHLKPASAPRNDNDQDSSPVDGHGVPIPHFGVVLTMPQWKLLAERVRTANIPFVIGPYTRFEGQVGEQSTMFFLDPAGNALEFKAFADLGQLFAR